MEPFNFPPTYFSTRPASNVALPLSFFLCRRPSHFVTSACLECAMRKGDLTNRSKAAVRVSAGGRAPNKTFPPSVPLSHTPPRRYIGAALGRNRFSQSPNPIQFRRDGRRRRPTIHVTLLVISSWHILPSVTRPTPSLSLPLHLRRGPRVHRRCCLNSLKGKFVTDWS